MRRDKRTTYIDLLFSFSFDVFMTCGFRAFIKSRRLFGQGKEIVVHFLFMSSAHSPLVIRI